MIRIPASRVAAGALPQVCAKHGHAAIETKAVKIISKPPVWAAPLIIVGALPYLIVVMALRKTVKAPAWPWCEECASERKTRFSVGFGLLALGLLLFVGAFALNNDTSGLLFAVGLLALLIGLIFALRGGVLPITGAFTSKDGQFVEVPKGSEHFAMVLSRMAARV
ncbi:hypothetical protein ACFPIJ_51515 [Dactylosporangium cerinum]|uniref:Uncharacterized protein n=1 Tax=Dactylosporangium cerinum TaxID=1434730 RepID=A0ABV9WBV9_9ACTN